MLSHVFKNSVSNFVPERIGKLVLGELASRDVAGFAKTDALLWIERAPHVSAVEHGFHHLHAVPLLAHTHTRW